MNLLFKALAFMLPEVVVYSILCTHENNEIPLKKELTKAKKKFVSKLTRVFVKSGDLAKN